MKPKEEVDAILMAAGFSKRFGKTNKLLAPFQGKPLARYTLELVSSLRSFCRIFFVTAVPAVQELAQGLPVKVIQNDKPGQGQQESIRLGVCASQGAYYMFFPCDQPLLESDTVYHILDLRRPGCIVQPVCKGIPSTPTLFSATFRDELLSLAPGEHPRDIKRRHPEAVITAAFPDSASLSLQDIDDPEMLKLLSLYARKGT